MQRKVAELAEASHAGNHAMESNGRENRTTQRAVEHCDGFVTFFLSPSRHTRISSRPGLFIEGVMKLPYAPIFQAEPSAKKGGSSLRFLKVWCPFCVRFHYHGDVTEPSGIVHLGAHCRGGPLVETGYFISLGKETKKQSRLAERWRQRHLK